VPWCGCRIAAGPCFSFCSSQARTSSTQRSSGLPVCFGCSVPTSWTAVYCPRANGHIMAAGPLFPRARASYDLVDVVVTSAFSRARFPVERQHSVSRQWIESASPGGAVVALGPVGLVPYLGRPPRPKRLARILQQAASQGNLVAGLLSVLRTEG
jgi:hypothetical protein